MVDSPGLLATDVTRVQAFTMDGNNDNNADGEVKVSSCRSDQTADSGLCQNSVDAISIAAT